MTSMHPNSSMQMATEIADAERAAAGGRAAPELIGNVRDAVIQFKEVRGYTTFLAEYATVDENFIVHFFPAKERYVSNGRGSMVVHGEALVKWQRTFPEVLDSVAQAYFNATAPRLQAVYTAEMFSWYFKAAGFAARLDPDGFILGFFEKLDAALDSVSF
jgi:hypothetical protein